MITLVSMDNEYYYSIYREYCINELAKQGKENGMWKEEEAYEKAKQEQDKGMANGVNTEDNHLYLVHSAELGGDVGEIWIGKIIVENMAYCFLFDIHIYEQYHNKGYGKEAMRAIEKEALAYGYQAIRLHTFRNNIKAQEMYKGIGYKVFREKENNIWMEKEIIR